ncbi:MAG TPA: DUF3987 domain-containing protein [Dehalococcoidia bacterium]|nr:DUF3987 domain-containing protein [Dehalococcoidia bacterium]
MRLAFEDSIEVEVTPNGRRPTVIVYRAGQLLDRAVVDLGDPLQRERWALQLAERHPAPWLDILRDVDLALAEEEEAFCGFVGDPLPFSPPPPFPLEALPEEAREFVTTGAAALDCPPDMVAAPFLGMVAGLIGHRQRLQVNPAWREWPSLWVAVVAAPGTAKSPALQLALSPLSRLQEMAYRRWREEMKAWEAQAAKARKEGERVPERPQLEHYFTTDSTLEGLAAILSQEEPPVPGLVMVRDELVSWVRSHDAYHPRGERQEWMKLWSGEAVKVDRATRPTAFIAEPAVSVVGGVQPDMLHHLEAEAGVADGFIERFLYSYPRTEPMRLRRDAPEGPDLTPLLLTLREAASGEVRMGGRAWEAFEAWHEANRHAQMEAVGLEARYLAKLPRQLLRLALVLHCLRYPESPPSFALSGETMRGAIELAAYFLSHARRVFLHFAEGATARRVVAVLRAYGGEAPQRTLWHHLSDAQRADLPLARRLLERLGVLEVAQVSPQGKGRPALLWRLVGGEKDTPPPTNPQNPVSDRLFDDD